ncbi:hypothetical protein ACLMJK_009589 [Lecanora helva]
MFAANKETYPNACTVSRQSNASRDDIFPAPFDGSKKFSIENSLQSAIHPVAAPRRFWPSHLTSDMHLAPLLTLLNTSTLLNTTSPISIPSQTTLECYGQNPPNETQLVPLIYKQCREVIAGIYTGQKALAPIVFGREAKAGFKVPHSWVFGSCVVSVDVTGDGVEETENFAAILKRAFDLAVECVIKPPHLGGRSFLGREGGLEVFLLGEDSGM